MGNNNSKNNLTEAEIKSKYRSKAKDSFKTRLRFYIFDYVVYKKKTFTEEDFFDFEITDKLIKQYTAEYYQKEFNDNLKIEDCELTISEIYDKIKETEIREKAVYDKWFEKYFKDKFEIQYPYKEFKEDLLSEVCHYCHITINMIHQLADEKKLYKKNARGWVMEIDRKQPNKEYTTENCVPSCYWCNNAKTDEFCDKEFKEVGEAIRKIWEKRLK